MSKVVDIYPDEVIEREETIEETHAREELQATSQANIVNAAAKADAKAALLERLGITADEAALLLG